MPVATGHEKRAAYRPLESFCQRNITGCRTKAYSHGDATLWDEKLTRISHRTSTATNPREKRGLTSARCALLVPCLIAAAFGARAAQPPIHECDRQAANYFDHQKASGVTGLWHHSQIDAAQALPVCREAVSLYPDAPRFQYQYARALVTAGRFEEALVWAQKAAAEGHAASYQGLAWLYATGKGVPKDPAWAYRLYVRAAEAGHAPAHYEIAYWYAQTLSSGEAEEVAERQTLVDVPENLALSDND